MLDIGITDSSDRSKLLKAIKNLVSNSVASNGNVRNKNQNFPLSRNGSSSFTSNNSPKNNNHHHHHNNSKTDALNGMSDKSVDDWLQFINSGSSQTSSRKNSKKKRRRRKSTTKKSPPRETRENVMNQLEKEIEEGLMPTATTTTNTTSTITSTPTNSMRKPSNSSSRNNNNNIKTSSKKDISTSDKLVISPHLYALDNGNWPVNNDDFDTFELDTFDAEVEAFRRRLEAATQETSSHSLFSSID